MATINVGYDAAGAAYTYTTIAAAISAATAGDTLVVWYYNAYKGRVWSITSAISVGKQLTIKGGLSTRRIQICGPNNIFNVTASGCVIENLFLIGYGYTVYMATAGATITINACRMHGQNYALELDGDGSVLYLNNCLVTGVFVGVQQYSGASVSYITNCTFFGMYDQVKLTSDTAVTHCNNNVFLYPGHNAVHRAAGAEYTTYILGSNNGCTVPSSVSGVWVPPTGRIALLSYEDNFVANRLNGHYPDDWRIVKGSYLASAGVDAGLTADIDGQAYAASTFPVGCSAGLDYVDSLLTAAGGTYAPDYPERENVTPDDTVGGLAGTLDLPELENVSSEDTLRGVTGGLDMAAYAAAYEASRNTAISPSIVKFNEDIFQFGVTDKGEMEADTVLVSVPHSGLSINNGVEVSNAPNAVTLSDGGNGLLRVEASGVAANAALYAYDDEDTFLGVLNPVATTDLLTEGQSVYFRASEPTMALSARYPLAECLVVPAIASATANARITELWRFKGLDADNPVVATGDGVISKTLASAGAKMTITEDGIVRTS